MANGDNQGKNLPYFIDPNDGTKTIKIKVTFIGKLCIKKRKLNNTAKVRKSKVNLLLFSLATYLLNVVISE